ncbi:hypothetical protein [Propionibacterium sp.]|uniref:hypothetical protein n=1 Tax=Propionibacterium sp. TaxID=1977903 RepID=UPI0039EBE8A8
MALRNPLGRSNPSGQAKPIKISRMSAVLLATVWIWFIAAPLFAIFMFALGRWPIGLLFAVITPFSWWALPVARRQYRAWPKRAAGAQEAQVGDAVALVEGLVTDGFRCIPPCDCTITVEATRTDDGPGYLVQCTGDGEKIVGHVPASGAPAIKNFLNAARDAGADCPASLPRG